MCREMLSCQAVGNAANDSGRARGRAHGGWFNQPSPETSLYLVWKIELAIIMTGPSSAGGRCVPLVS